MWVLLSSVSKWTFFSPARPSISATLSCREPKQQVSRTVSTLLQHRRAGLKQLLDRLDRLDQFDKVFANVIQPGRARPYVNTSLETPTQLCGCDENALNACLTEFLNTWCHVTNVMSLDNMESFDVLVLSSYLQQNSGWRAQIFTGVMFIREAFFIFIFGSRQLMVDKMNGRAVA